MFNFGFGREVITPKRGIGLAGYFNARPNRGVLDDLFVKALLMEKDGVTTGFLVYDLCFLTVEAVEEIRSEVKKAGFDFADRLIYSAIHTHTGPQFSEFFGLPFAPEYVEVLKAKSVAAVRTAAAGLAPGELLINSGTENPFSFVRRYWMKNGTVVTNPGRNNPDVVKPESDFDRTVTVLGVRQEGRLAAVMVNLANHTDTIDGDLVSADWPGRMEREIQYQLGEDVPVMTFIDASGDINHFDIRADFNQSCYEEALRIGRGYAKIVLGLLNGLQPVEADRIEVSCRSLEIPYRDIPAEKLAAAKELLATVPEENESGSMTSEGIASGSGAVARFFAASLIEYAQVCSGKSRRFELTAIKLGKELAFVSLPGEPFNGIARAIRAKSPLGRTVIISLAQGECGYIAMPECFDRGGYEVLPVVGGSPREDTAERLIAETLKNLGE